MSPAAERRRFVRAAVRWPVRLARTRGAPVTVTETENVSVQGFFCWSPEPFQVGDSLECVLALPPLDIGHYRETVQLRCRVTVVHIVHRETSSGRGLGCRFEDLHLVLSN